MVWNIYSALLGGAIIGLSVSIMLLFNGRVTGISGIVKGLLSPIKTDISWRLLFVLGLVLGGFAMKMFGFTLYSELEVIGRWQVIIAGFIVGVGTSLGSGCTSGHGVCGISRLSTRSIIATCTFMATGFTTVFILRLLGGL
ncbi:MAG: YeeE/YedE family protein [Bdellovibrionales bacterium]